MKCRHQGFIGRCPTAPVLVETTAPAVPAVEGWLLPHSSNRARPVTCSVSLAPHFSPNISQSLEPQEWHQPATWGGDHKSGSSLISFSQTFWWPCWGSDASSLPPAPHLESAGWQPGCRCHSPQTARSPQCNPGQRRWSSAWPCGRAAAEGSAGPPSGEGCWRACPHGEQGGSAAEREPPVNQARSSTTRASNSSVHMDFAQQQQQQQGEAPPSEVHLKGWGASPLCALWDLGGDCAGAALRHCIGLA